MSYKTFKFRLEPTKAQSEQLSKFTGSARYVFNHFLAVQRDLYNKRKETGDTSIKFLSYHQCSALLTQLKQEEATSWLYNTPGQCLQQSLMHLEIAIKNWLGKKTGFPSFKKKGVNDSVKFSVAPRINFENRTIKLTCLDWIKYRKSREVTGTVKSATVTRNGKHWYISILAEQCENLEPHPSNTAIGIDMGVTHFATLSTGEHINAPSLKHLTDRITSLQQRLSHKQKGSNNRKKARYRLSAAYAKLRNVRQDFLHKVTTNIAKNHCYVAMEDLRIKNMTKSAKGTVESPGKCVKQKSGLNRSILSQAWGMFRNLLTYKLDELNGELRLVDPRFTSQTCSVCLTTSKNSRKSQSKFVCVACGHTVNADHNAATNILRLSSLGTVA